MDLEYEFEGKDHTGCSISKVPKERANTPTQTSQTTVDKILLGSCIWIWRDGWMGRNNVKDHRFDHITGVTRLITGYTRLAANDQDDTNIRSIQLSSIYFFFTTPRFTTDERFNKFLWKFLQMFELSSISHFTLRFGPFSKLLAQRGSDHLFIEIRS